MTLDEELSAATYTTARNYLARGYTQNTWTFKDMSHFSGGANIATTDKAEEGAMLVRQVCPSGELKATSAQLASGKIQAQCKTYNGWNVEKECENIPSREVSPTGGKSGAVLSAGREQSLRNLQQFDYVEHRVKSA